MTKIIILTKNLLAEQNLQAALQRSNSEVYCTYNLMKDASSYSQMLRYFSVVIFSDTISTLELSKYYSPFKENGLLILRKGDKDALQASEYSALFEEISGWISNDTLNVDIIEKIAKLETSYTKSSDLSDLDRHLNLFFHALTVNEKKLVYCLYQAEGNVLSRGDLCQLMWEDSAKGIASQMSQLSNIKKRIKQKLIRYGFSADELTTFWGQGYSLGECLFKSLTNSRCFENFILKK